jgi:acetolactate synthase regulatory subunit
MSQVLEVRVKRAEGCLLRVLGQIGRRGYEVTGVTARLSADGKSFDMVVEFVPYQPIGGAKPRPPEVLPALVEKLVDVERAVLKPKPAPAREKAEVK